MSFTTIIFCYIEKTSPETCGGEIEKNEMIKSIIKKQVSLCSLDLDWFFCFVFEKVSSSLPMLLVMLVVAKRSNSRSQVIFKTSVLKNFVILTGKHLCWSLFLLNYQDWRPAFLYKKRLQHRFFSVNIAKFLRTPLL